MIQAIGRDKPFHLLDTISRTALCDDLIRTGLYVENYDLIDFMNAYLESRHGKGKNTCTPCLTKYRFRKHVLDCDQCELYQAVCAWGKDIQKEK